MGMLTISHISKSFGSTKVLDDLCFSVPEHSVFGFIGQNGAGKTTTMKIVLGLLKADCGEVRVCGERVAFGQNKTNRHIGYLPDVPEFYGFMTPSEYLILCGHITGGMEEKELKSRINEMLKLVGLEGHDKRIQGFSRGMKQRLGIAQALLNRPELLICDEPTSALDPAGRREILDILQAVRSRTTVIFSTHILSDVERICDEVAVLHKGRIALQGTINEVKQYRKAEGFIIELEKPEDAVLICNESLLGNITSVVRTDNLPELKFEAGSEEDMLAVLELIVREHLAVKRIERMEPTLESLFLEVTEA